MRNLNVRHTLETLASDAADDPRIDGALTIVAVGKGLEFFAAGVLLDRPKDALAALAVLYERVRRQIEEEMTVSEQSY